MYCLSNLHYTVHTTLTDDVVVIKDILEVTSKKDLKTQKAKKNHIFFQNIFWKCSSLDDQIGIPTSSTRVLWKFFEIIESPTWANGNHEQKHDHQHDNECKHKFMATFLLEPISLPVRFFQGIFKL